MTATLTLGQAVAIGLGFWCFVAFLTVMLSTLWTPPARRSRWDRTDSAMVVCLLLVAVALYSAGLWAVVNLVDWVKP